MVSFSTRRYSLLQSTGRHFEVGLCNCRNSERWKIRRAKIHRFVAAMCDRNVSAQDIYV